MSERSELWNPFNYPIHHFVAEYSEENNYWIIRALHGEEGERPSTFVGQFDFERVARLVADSLNQTRVTHTIEHNVKYYTYVSWSETMSFAVILGYDEEAADYEIEEADKISDQVGKDTTEAIEQDALRFIRSKGYRIKGI